MPIDFVNSLVEKMRKVSWLYWPLMIFPPTAYAAQPQGFEDFYPIY